jgi:hypothetical protein
MANPRAKRLTANELVTLMRDLQSLTEDEALAVIDNPFVTSQILGQIGNTERLAALYSVRLRLVAHRKTPQAHASKLVHYLYWFDLLRLSVDVTVPAPVRRAIEARLLLRVGELTPGERIASAKRCSAALIKHFLFDPDPRVFEALMVNQRVREEEILLLASSPAASSEKLTILGADRKWSSRYSIRKALAMNPKTPRAVAAAQLRHLRRADLRKIHGHPDTTVYIRRCIERLEHHTSSAVARRID